MEPLGLVDGASVYGYALQNPGRYTDPTGEAIPLWVGLAVLGIAHDYLSDEGCYTLGDFALSLALNFSPTRKVDTVLAISKSAAQNAAKRAAVKKKIAPNNGNAKKHGSERHNKAIDDVVNNLKNDRAVTNIRKNQTQVDVSGNKVGRNRPDIQYDMNGCHHCLEIDNSRSASIKHGQQIRQNDPSTKIDLRILSE